MNASTVETGWVEQDWPQLQRFHFAGVDFWTSAGLDIRYLFHGWRPFEAQTRRNVARAVFFAIHGGKTLLVENADGQQAQPATQRL